ncbi:MAG: hypothetical protein JNL73_02315 [Anaerolineales bacterium]|nr:hypothetical protein [Anaerolineales bacterium]
MRTLSPFRWSTLISGVAVLGLLLAACGPASTPIPLDEPTAAPTAGGAEPTAGSAEPTQAAEPTAAPVAAGGTVKISFVQEPDTLNPIYSAMYFSTITRDFWLRGLFIFDEQLNPVPQLAAEVPTTENGGISADGKTITVKLREGVTWSDGEPVTGDDFVFTYEMIVSEKNTVQTRYPYDTVIDSVTAPDAGTVVIKLTQVFAAWRTSLFLFVLPKHVLQPVFDADGTLDNAEWNRAPTVGVGPFVYEEFESGSHLSFVANPNWFEPPSIERVFIQIVPDDAAQEAAIIAGDVDLGLFLSSDQIERLEAGGAVKVVAVQSGYDEGWFLNLREGLAHPAMLDKNVRLALALATDRFTIVRDLLVEDLNPVNATFWSNNPPYASKTLEPYPYDPEKAMSLLDEAGWTDSDGDGIRDKMIDGKKVDLELRYVTTTRELRKNVQAVVAQQWEAVGIRADLRNVEADQFFAGYADQGPVAIGDFDVAEWSDLPTSFPDPDASEKWRCADIPTDDNPSGQNQGGYCNPEFDKLLEEQSRITDADARIAVYEQIQQMMYDDVAYIGLWLDPDLWSINQRVQGVSIGGVNPFWNVTTWTLK